MATIKWKLLLYFFKTTVSQLIFGNISSWIRLPVENSVKNARAKGNTQKSVFFPLPVKLKQCKGDKKNKVFWGKVSSCPDDFPHYKHVFIEKFCKNMNTKANHHN